MVTCLCLNSAHCCFSRRLSVVGKSLIQSGSQTFVLTSVSETSRAQPLNVTLSLLKFQTAFVNCYPETNN